MRTPNQIGSYPNLVRAGRIIGKVINIAATISRKKPNIIYMTITASNIPMGGAFRFTRTSEIIAGNLLMDRKRPNKKAQAIIRRTEPAVLATSYKVFFRVEKLSFLKARAITKVMKAPTAPDSVGVNMPV